MYVCTYISKIIIIIILPRPSSCTGIIFSLKRILDIFYRKLDPLCCSYYQQIRLKTYYSGHFSSILRRKVLRTKVETHLGNVLYRMCVRLSSRYINFPYVHEVAIYRKKIDVIYFNDFIHHPREQYNHNHRRKKAKLDV